jgi:hypothetical protein
VLLDVRLTDFPIRTHSGVCHSDMGVMTQSVCLQSLILPLDTASGEVVLTDFCSGASYQLLLSQARLAAMKALAKWLNSDPARRPPT